MFRVLLFLLVLIAAAFGLAWLIDRPGEIVLNWQGYRIETSVLVGLGIILTLVAIILTIWSLLRFAFRLPPTLSGANRTRRREKGYAALSRGIIAVGSGDAVLALKSAAEAQRHLRDEPLALLLRAEAAQLAGHHHAVEAAFREMTQRNDMRLLGLRGLHAHAHRRGDVDTAHHFASTAHGITALPWTSSAVIERHVAAKDWQGALAAVEHSGAANFIGKSTRDRQRAVLTTAIALDNELTAPDEALRLARTAIKRAPDLVPALALAARLSTRRGEIRRATKMIEAAWPVAAHPDLAKIYLDLRPGDSNADRLARARILFKLSPRDPESRVVLASAAIAACDYQTARDTMLPLIQGAERPTARMCLIMAELEEAEHGDSGYIREWLARASRAPRDAIWVADGVMSQQWLPASPVTRKLDAFVWRRPDEHLGADGETDEAVFSSIPGPSESPALIEQMETKAIAPPAPEEKFVPVEAAAGESASESSTPEGEVGQQPDDRDADAAQTSKRRGLFGN
ncbi:heme biosynthesis protein HemY [Beijerinckiaceae bacterium]|nr:heme biosynthesis protein HemY [Beijerinckiaceae bacterium]